MVRFAGFEPRGTCFPPSSCVPVNLMQSARFASLFVCALLALATSARGADQPEEITFDGHIRPFLRQYCQKCHGVDEPMAGISFTKLNSLESLLKNRGAWEKSLRMLRGRMMPPEDEPQPGDGQREEIAAWIEAELNNFDCAQIDDPGRVTIRRLNRVEYDNTIRDLLGIDFAPGEDFPPDDVGYGFDNIGDVLSLPTLLMEKYLAAAETISAQVIPLPAEQPGKLQTVPLASGQTQGRLRKNNDEVAFTSSGTIRYSLDWPKAGRYEVVVTAFGDQAGDEPARMAVKLGDADPVLVSVPAEEDAPAQYRVSFTVTGGKQSLALSFVNDYYNPKASNPKQRDRNLFISEIGWRGPIEDETKSKNSDNAWRLTVWPDQNKSWEAAARENLTPLVNRAYRREVGPAEVERFVQLSLLAKENGDSFEVGMRLALEATLTSPHFLFRIEDTLPAEKAADGSTSNASPIDEFALATRLSYFLWSSMPDERLFTLARQGKLRANLAEEVRRMLADPRSEALVTNFAGQWLQLRELEAHRPDAKRFPQYTPELRDAMRRETELLFAALLREDRSVLSLLDADFTFVNETLAKHYGMKDVKGQEFRRVSLEGVPRRGVLTHASILTITSNPTRTSPVKRGKWILDNILSTPPPPPPPNVPELEEEEAELTGSLRERLEQHRASPTCNSCHSRMDPLGFGLENYNAIGGYREKDGKFAIDSSGELADGAKFDGPLELLQLLRQQESNFRRSIVEKMLTYALGRGLEYYDKCAVDEIGAEMERNDNRFSALIMGVVESDPFQLRRNAK